MHLGSIQLIRIFYGLCVLDLWFTVTTYFSQKYREYVYRITWTQGSILSFGHLIYHRIYRKNLVSGFSKSTVNLIGQNALKSWVLTFKLSKQDTSIDWIFYWLHANSVSIRENSLLFNIFLVSFYQIYRKPFFFWEWIILLPSLLNPILKMS